MILCTMPGCQTTAGCRCSAPTPRPHLGAEAMTAPNDVAALVKRAKNDPHPQFREWMHGMGGLEDGLVARFQQVTTAGVRPASRWIVGSLGNKSRDESDSRAYTTLHAANRIVELEAALEAAKQQRDEFQTEAFEAATTIAALTTELRIAKETAVYERDRTDAAEGQVAALQAEVERANEALDTIARGRIGPVSCLGAALAAMQSFAREACRLPAARSASRKETNP